PRLTPLPPRFIVPPHISACLRYLHRVQERAAHGAEARSLHASCGLREAPCIALFLNTQKFRGWLERHSVNPLIRQLHRIKTYIADLIALLLHRDVKPVLLLDGVALALVVTGRVSLFGLLLRSVVECFADDDSARCTSGGDEWVTVRDFVTEIRAACAESRIADGARGCATGKQAGDKGEREQFGCVGD